jgi:hypothetical protein
VCSEPLDEQNAKTIVDRHDESVVVSLDIENDPLSRNDAGGTVLRLQLCGCFQTALSASAYQESRCSFTIFC